MTRETVFTLRDRGDRVRVYQVDVTNHCNAACWYCPHPTHARAKGFMDLETFAAVLDVASNDSFHLHHFSEPLLHRKLPQMVSMAAERGFKVGFSTNGQLLNQRKLDDLAARGLAWLRLHVSPFNVRLDQFKVPDGLLMTEHRVGNQGAPDAPEKEMISYGGHVDGLAETNGAARCSYLGYPDGEPWKVVLWDGSFAMCCVDIEGDNDPALCNGCRGFVFKGPLDWGDYDGEQSFG